MRAQDVSQMLSKFALQNSMEIKMRIVSSGGEDFFFMYKYVQQGEI